MEKDKERNFFSSLQEIFEQETQKGFEQKIDEEETTALDDDFDAFAKDEEDFDEEDYEHEEKEEIEPQEKKKGKPISQRKRKEKQQMSLFDYYEDSSEKTPQEQVKEWGLKRGSNIESGKFRIYDEYQSDPTLQDFAEFLRKEYGIGGSYRLDQEESHSGKGLSLAWRDKEHPEKDVVVTMNWTQVADGIADLIDDGNYFTADEQEEYNLLLNVRAERTNAQSETEKLKIIARQFIDIATKNTWNGIYDLEPHRFEESAQFVRDHKTDLEQVLLSEKEVIEILPTQFPYADSIKVRFDTRVCLRLQDEFKVASIVDFIVKQGTKNTSGGNWIIYFDEFEDEQYVKDNLDQIVAELKSREEVAETEITLDGIDTTYWLDYCANITESEEDEDYEVVENTDLNEVGLDQTELGGAKQRYRNNLAAIRLTNLLNDEDRTPTAEEKKILAMYVGWGGLAQVFDEANPQWNREYNELKASLSIADYERAKGSVLNAHYTSKEVIEAMYKALARFGVQGKNRILEPAMGTGNFFGFMPKEIASGTKLYGVELDNLTGGIAAKLYPQVKVQIKGFEETSFPNGYFDVVVSNVPFGGYGVADSDYNRYKFLIHDYFIAKSLDKVRANGVVAVITSKGTMDKLNPSVRKYLADRAELLGAIRLPNTAFKQTANTEVVTDILFFRKRDEQINSDITNTEWLSTGNTEQGFEVNSYFVNHSEMVLGTFEQEHGLYGAMDITVKPDGRELTTALNEAIERLPKDWYENPTEVYSEQEEAEVDYNVKPLNYTVENGRLYMRIGDRMVEQEVPKSPKDAYERITDMIELRKQLRNILEIQTKGCAIDQLENEQRILNANYDRFVRHYGFVNSQTNARLFRDDGDSALLFACEELSEDKQSATKADVFTKRTIRPYVAVTSTDDCFEALQISKNEHGRVDIAYIEELTKKDYDTVLSELSNAVFRNPLEVDPQNKYSGFETAEEYLSGKVVQKLQTAKMFVVENLSGGYEKNVSALEKVQPTPLTAADISVRLGASWVDKEYYKEFLLRLLGVPKYYMDGLELYFNPHDSSWRVDKANYVRSSAGMKSTEVYGTNRANAFRLFEDCLNLRATNIYDTIIEDDREKRVLNQAETIAAREKQNKIKEAFRDWIFNDPKRREELEATYNRLFNQIRLSQYDGSYLHFPEMNPAIDLRPHQKNAVHRIITSGNTLLHHVVGSGKTYTMCAAMMKLRQYGLAKKPMIAVPNHLVEQWASEFRMLYPNAKLLIANKDDLAKENRQKFVSKVALGDWDAVIIAQSSFAKIPISPERQIAKVHEEIAKIDVTIAKQYAESGFPRGKVKNLERIKKNKETQLKRLLDDNKKDNLLNFESLGVDYLFIDEAHFYKNKFLYTKMNNVAGISTTASQRAADLELKVEFINELHNGDKGVVFATGTPISNSMTEMYTMQSYLQKRTLDEVGLNYFDGWAADFGETITSLELAPNGQGYKPRTRFAKFTNLPELQTFYRMFADVQTADMVKLNVPEAERKIVNLKPSETVIELAEQIAERAERINGGGVDPHVDNMLKVTSDGKKLALDARCFDSIVGDEDGSKLNACAENIYDIWESTKEKHSTQIVFCDLSTPKMAFEDYEYGKNFDVYNDLKHKLTERGIPQQEIAFIHDANTDLQKQDLFKKVNSGQVRVILGSTEKCGAGTNAQQRLIALHHLDTPYRPSDMEQREGRIIRQGNTNEKVQIFTYVTERTFDSYSYQILENKQRFISQICHGDMMAREVDDIDETTLSYAEIKAITAANPRIKRKMEVDSEVAKLRVLEGQYRKSLYSLQDSVNKTFPEQIQKQILFLQRLREDMEKIKTDYDPDIFSISVNGAVYMDKKDGGKALTDALYASRPDRVVAEYGGFKISMNPLVFMTIERSVTVAGSGQYNLEIGQSSSGNITRLDNFFADFPNKETRAMERLVQLQRDFETAKSQLEVPFEHKEKLMVLLGEQAELNAELDLNRREEIVIDDDSDNDDEQSMALPERRTERAVRRQGRKPLNKYSMSEYDRQKVQDPDAFIFVKNGYNYEMFGEQAERYAEAHGLPIIADTLDGAKTLVLSLESEELDKTIRELIEGGKTVKIIETLEEKKEDKFIDNVDKVAAMEIALLPDYSRSQERMHRYGYKWDGMLPLSRHSARTLLSLGLEVYRLYPDDTQSGLDDETSLISHEGLFGIEKPDWNAFLQTDKAKEYFAARLFVANAAGKVANEDMSYVGAEFIDGFIDKNYDEREALTQFVRQREMSDMEKLYPYVDGLLNEFTSCIASNVPLEEYGWIRSDVPRAIANHITSEELKEYALVLAKQGFDDELKMETSVTANEIDYKQAVIESVKKEYELFKQELMKLPPEELFQKNYEIHIMTELKEVIIQEDYLAPEQYRSLYEEGDYILSSLYGTFLSDEYASVNTFEDTADFIFNYNLDYHEEIMLAGQELTEAHLPIYLNTWEYAEANNERWLFNNSRKLSKDCLNAVGVAIKENYQNNVLKEGFENKLVEKFGIERVKYVLATIIQNSHYDGRYSIENKEWAKGITVSENEEERRSIYTNEHPGLVDLLAQRIRLREKENINEEEQTMAENKVEEKDHWQYVFVENAAKIAEYENRTLLKMPQGEYEGCVYYIPNKLLKVNEEKGNIRVGLPEDFVIKLQDKPNNKEVNLTVEEYIAAVKGKGKEFYKQFNKPSESVAEKFAETEVALRRNVPNEMKERPNWVAVRTRENKEKGRLEKFLIDCNTGNFAESDNAATWTDFESACAYARGNGGETLAYTLDGKDGVCCIDLDHCKDGEGYTPLASEVMQKCGKTYMEVSVSGNGLHVFGKTSGMDLRTFSKNGDLEFYQKSHFIAMTGDGASYQRLESFDSPEIKNLLEQKCERRTEWKGISKGLEGLSVMSDRDIVEKASSSKNGETFKALYNGEDLQNNRSNSDMSLMNRLAFWCNGDKEQMLRIFATSGLFRENKSPDYYETTAIKSLRGTSTRYLPTIQNSSNSDKKNENSNGKV